MKVEVWHHPEPVNLTVDVTVEDLEAAMTDPAMSTKFDATVAANMAGTVLKAIPDNLIEEMTHPLRRIVREFLLTQANRFAITSVVQAAEELEGRADSWAFWLEDPNRSFNPNSDELLAKVIRDLLAAVKALKGGQDG